MLTLQARSASFEVALFQRWNDSITKKKLILMVPRLCEPCIVCSYCFATLLMSQHGKTRLTEPWHTCIDPIKLFIKQNAQHQKTQVSVFLIILNRSLAIPACRMNEYPRLVC